MSQAKKGETKHCDSCNKDLVLNNFYNTKSPLSTDGKMNICKKCLGKMIDADNIDTVYKVLQMMDLPFFYDSWERAKEKKPDNPWASYIVWANTGFNEFSGATYRDSIFEAKEDQIPTEAKRQKELNDDVNIDELEDKWGYGYTSEELVAFEKKYQKLINNYDAKTEMHKEALLTYIRYRVKEEIATAKGLVKEAKDWADMANKAATNAKINPNQLSKADLTDGLSTFSELSLAIEKEVDIIPILPKFKCRPNDALDFNIWCYVNYERDLAGLPLCDYKDVYQFYDQRKKEYVEQYGDPYGIFSDDTSKKNRDNIIKFIKED